MIVIGGGAAGLVAAGMSALLGARTTLVEEHRLGGDCTWSGCIPSKTLLRAARIAHQMRTAGRYGLNACDPEIPFARVMEHVRRVRQHVYEDADAPPHFERMGVTVLAGRACFCDPRTIELVEAGSSRRKLTSRYFVIATGSRPRMPGFGELCLSNETLFELTEQPKRLLVMGAGPVGIEMAQAFRRLGSAVTVVEPEERILPKDDAELTDMLRMTLEEEGISFRFGRSVSNVERAGGELRGSLDNGEAIACDAVLAAIGREPNVRGLGLENAGVAFSDRGIALDRHCKTSQKHIYASGDVTGRYQFTHMAEHMSKIAVTNAILRWPASVDERHVTWCTFTEPELAQVGECEESLRQRNTKYQVYRLPFTKLDRAITEGETTGLVKVLAGRSGRILGASILGVNAGEMIAEYALAMRHGLPLSKISNTIHPYPTYVLGNRRAADQWYTRQLDSPLLGLLGKILGYRGERRGSAAL